MAQRGARGDAPDPAIYGHDTYYPEAPVQPGTEGCQRGRRLLPVRVFPFQYNPAAQTVLYHPHVKVVVRVSGSAQGSCSQGAAPSTGVAGAEAIGAEAGALLVRTAERGMYGLTYADLQTAGVPLDTVDPASFRMTLGGQAVRLQVQTQTAGHFAQGDLVIFYAEPYTGRWSTTNVYRFSWGPDAAPAESRMLTRGAAKTGPVLTTVIQSLHVERNYDYYSTYPASVEADHFFDAPLSLSQSTPSASASYDLALDDPLQTGTVKISGLVYGGKSQAANPDQSFELKLNSQAAGVQQWDGRVGYQFSTSVTASALLPTGNKLSVTAALSQLPALTDYYIYPDSFDLLYPASSEVETDRVFVAGLDTSATAVQMQFTGFTGSTVRAYDVRDPKSPVILTTVEAGASGPPYSVNVWDSWNALDSAPRMRSPRTPRFSSRRRSNATGPAT